MSSQLDPAGPRDQDQVSGPVGRWLSGLLGDAGPFGLRPLSGGNSNETFELTSPAGSWVLRRPPAARISERANDVRREYVVLTALAGTGVPAPRPVGLCTDPAVSAQPLLVMEHVRGTPLIGELPPGWPGGAPTVAAAGAAAIDALASLHRLDYQAAGLADFGRPAGFLDRQVARWRRQFESYAVRPLELFEPVARWLEGNRPPDGEPALLHGDFHADNCLFSPRPAVRLNAIIDWEMATIGDPLLDLGLFLGFWGSDRSPRPAMPRLQEFSRRPGAPSRAELAARYEAATGRSVEHLTWYMTLAFWKLAAIVEGAYAQLVAGQVATDYARRLAADVPALLAEAAALAGL